MFILNNIGLKLHVFKVLSNLLTIISEKIETKVKTYLILRAAAPSCVYFS